MFQLPIQLPIITYPTRTFRCDTLNQYSNRAFQSLTKPSVPRSRVYGGILHTIHDDPAQVRYLLVQGRYSGKWSFPKGHSYEGEDPLTCAKREIAEETGQDTLPAPVEYTRIGYGNYYVFVCHTMFAPAPRDTGEIMAAEWVTLTEMSHLSLNVDVSRFQKKQSKQIMAENVPVCRGCG
jgi:ADP-ribose pyrophosphatase YjhB (NUDIX family)